MSFRKIISLSIGISFLVLLVSGLLSYILPYSRITASLHTIFGLIFSVGILLHLRNNFRPIKNYIKSKFLPLILLAVLSIALVSFLDTPPVSTIMDFGARQKAASERTSDRSQYELIEMNTGNDLNISIDLLRSTHYWHPQMAIWIEDEQGNYVETLFVSKATARGLFFGGRTKDNFKSFDTENKSTSEYRRVNALPVWSRKRGVVYSDGSYVPSREEPLPDAISGATITDSFILSTSTSPKSRFTLRIEINVAFDDNEYYSEYDFPDDEVFHNGTGQLGQPSIVFESKIDMNDGRDYYLMELIGHGHHSAQTGDIDPDLSTLTTALELVERIVVGVNDTAL